MVHKEGGGLHGGRYAVREYGGSGAGGGPKYATYLLAYSIYDKAFNGFKYGYAMAQVMVLFVIILAFTIVVFKSSDAYVYYENN